jgi:ATP-dependent Clp protease ATP-binding subunit ClpA
MFERISEKTMRSIVLAQEEARRLRQGMVHTEHLLLGLALEGTNSIAMALTAENVQPADLRTELERRIRAAHSARTGDRPFSPHAKRALEFSWDEARKGGSDKILPEHLFAGLCHLPECGAMVVLASLRVNVPSLRSVAARKLGATPTLAPPDHVPPEFARRKLQGQADDIQVALDVLTDLSFTLATMQDAFARLDVPPPNHARDEFVVLNERLMQLDQVLEESPERLRAEIKTLREKIRRILED